MFVTGKGWLPNFYKVYVSQTYSTIAMLLTIASSYGLKENQQHGEVASANPEDIMCKQVNLKEINARYKPEDRFNGDESYINPFNPPDRGLATHKISGKKKNKVQLTIFFVCNSMGTKKLPPFFIGKSKQPHCFKKKTGKQLGFYYRNNKKAWMTGFLFEE